MKQLVWIILGIVSIAFFSFNCKDVGLQAPDKTFTLTTEDASCTEVWLKFNIGAGITNREVTFKRDSVTLFTRTFHELETVLLDTNLSPNHTYVYTAFLTDDSKTRNSTTQVQTMDTTSHNFGWTTTTLGDGTGSSYLNDIAIINDTLAYAVGEIWQGGTTYNAAKWNGNTWQLMKIHFLYFCDQSDTFPFPAQAIWAFSENDIWISSGSQIVRWNGLTQTTPVCIPVSVNKLWGENQNSMYAVGVGGSIAHYYNGIWTKIESGTGLDIYDIFGSRNNNGELEIYAVAAQQFVSFDKAVLKINGNSVVSLSTENIPYSIHGIWFKPGIAYWTVGSGMFFKRVIQSQDFWRDVSVDITGYYTYAVDGNDINDILVCGSQGELLHYNGISWKSYQSQTYFNGELYAVSVKNNLCISVGGDSQKARIIIGRK